MRVGGRGDVQEIEDLLLFVNEFGVKGLHDGAAVVELVAADGREELQDPCRARSARGPAASLAKLMKQPGELSAEDREAIAEYLHSRFVAA